MYGIAIILSIELLDDCSTVQKWYADNGNAVGSLDKLKKLFDLLKKHGPVFGFLLTKCHIITKQHFFEKAQKIFVHKKIEIVDDCRVFDSAIGSDNAEKKFVEKSQKTAEIVVQRASRLCQCFTSKRI